MRVSLTITTLTIWTTVFLTADSIKTENLTCYQCARKSNVECGEADLLPCSPVYDRCVTHITKDKSGDFTINRECGLAPCGFNDEMVDRGLGFDKCDRSKHEYFCILCCKGNGCNKSASNMPKFSKFLLSVSLLIAILSIIKNYQPPYLSSNDMLLN
ncbi:hypothetical protein QE152_g9526 [Popillia japonica]|uniref:Protein sleepless n=1 Tax=Popillia japonica TaxID=7064 RepID=A0AAW1LUE5_POPJA